MDTAQTSNEPTKQREQVGWCEYQPLEGGARCGQPAIYIIDFKVDDMTAALCNHHMDMMLMQVGLPDCEGDE